jgi:hypothetical protein
MPHALQDDLRPPPFHKQVLDDTLRQDALQDDFFRQPDVLVGLIAHLTGLALQDDIAMIARRLQQLGRDILSGSPSYSGGRVYAQTPYLIGQTQNSPQPVQLGRPTPGAGALH